MKLYTEEQVKMAIQMGDKYHYLLETEEDGILKSLTPIELPSDEEIEKQSEHEDTYSKKCAFTRGAKWMWRKTFGGNNEQQ